MVTTRILKEKVTKILTIVQQLDNEYLNAIERDILLQELRDLYSFILLDNACETTINESQHCDEIPSENIDTDEVVKADVEPEQPAQDNAITIAFDDFDYDYSDIIGSKKKKKNAFQVEEISQVAAENVVVETTVEHINEKVETIADNVSEKELVVDSKLSELKIESPILNHASEPVSSVEKVQPEPQIFVANDVYIQEVTKPEVTKTPEPKVETKPETKPEPKVETKPESKIAVKSEPKGEEKPIFENVVKTEVSSNETSPMTLGEQLGQTRQSSLNDRFATSKTTDLSSRFAQKPIDDIKSAMGLGDRFRYVKELFQGNGMKFDETVAYLNGLDNLAEAKDYIAQTLNCDMEADITADFLNIVARKYIK